MALAIFCLALLCFSVHTARCDDARSMIVSGLGRPFTLGALYDATRDSLVPGRTFWNQSNLSANRFEKDFPNTAAKLIAGSGFSEKADAFDMSAQLKASFYGGLVQVQGAAKYLKSSSSSNYQAEISFMYHRRTHFAKLTSETLSKVDYPDVFDIDNGATHVVTAIEYGADVVFRFHYMTSSTEQKESIQGDLQAKVNLGFTTVEGSASLDLNSTQKSYFSSISCEFNGDVNVPKSPTTMLDALEVYQSLPSLITSDTSIPIRVYLTPLSHIDSDASRLVREISENLLTEVTDRFDAYDEIERAIGDLQQSPAYELLPLFQDHLDSFQSAVDVHKNRFSADLLEVLPSIRGGGNEESQLVELLDSSQAMYTISELQNWIELKQTEAGALYHLLEWMPEIVITKPGEFEKILYNTDNQYILSFSLNLYSSYDDFAQCVKHNCESDSDSYYCAERNCAQNMQLSSWVNDQSFAADLYRQFAKFKEIVERNEQLDTAVDTIFLIAEDAKTDQPSAGLYLYKNVSPLTKMLQFPAIEVKIENSCKTASVSWTVEDSPYLMGDFHIRYRDSRSDDWTTIESVRGSSVAVPFDTDLEVEVDAFCSFGVCASVYKHFCGAINCAILLIGGVKNNTALELYYTDDPSSSRFLSRKLSPERQGHSSIVLPDGSVLTVGGRNDRSNTDLVRYSSCGLFWPETQTFSACAPLNYALL